MTQTVVIQVIFCSTEIQFVNLHLAIKNWIPAEKNTGMTKLFY